MSQGYCEKKYALIPVKHWGTIMMKAQERLWKNYLKL